jgi:putative transposase
LLGCHADKLTGDGRQRLVRHGHLPEREIMTGIGAVVVRCPRVRDCVGEGSDRIRFSSAILPHCARRSKSLEVLIPEAGMHARIAHRRIFSTRGNGPTGRDSK